MKLKLSVYTVSVLTLFLFSVSTVGARDMLLPLPTQVDAVGVGIGMAPDYEGSDDYLFGGLPVIHLNYGQNRYVRLMGTSLEWNISNNHLFEFGPIGNYRFGRDDNVDDVQVSLMQEVDSTFEVGVFMGFLVKDQDDLRKRYSARLEIMGDAGSGHDGILVQVSARYYTPVSRAVVLGISGGATYATSNYMDAYFSVSSADNILSGLMTYQAESGVKDIYIQPMMLMSFSRNWHMGIAVRFKTMLSDAKDSPVVDVAGDSTQILGGVGIAYTW
jgi:outer membrane protein